MFGKALLYLLLDLLVMISTKRPSRCNVVVEIVNTTQCRRRNELCSIPGNLFSMDG